MPTVEFVDAGPKTIEPYIVPDRTSKRTRNLTIGLAIAAFAVSTVAAIAFANYYTAEPILPSLCGTLGGRILIGFTATSGFLLGLGASLSKRSLEKEKKYIYDTEQYDENLKGKQPAQKLKYIKDEMVELANKIWRNSKAARAAAAERAKKEEDDDAAANIEAQSRPFSDETFSFKDFMPLKSEYGYAERSKVSRRLGYMHYLESLRVAIDPPQQNISNT